MDKSRVLIITQEIDPYTGLSEIAQIVHDLLMFANNKDIELRVLMPRYGTINERRHRLHEVVRLSGMNIVVNDDDYPLIIKVTSLPGSRIQVYFLDNEDFFKRKSVFQDSEGKSFEDNHDRMLFFCKGALEIVKKFGWSPDIVHCHGWFTSMTPLLLKTVYKNDPLFQNAKVIYSMYNNSMEAELQQDFLQTTIINNVQAEDALPYMQGGVLSLDTGAAFYADGIIVGSKLEDVAVMKQIKQLNKPILDNVGTEGDYLQAYTDFYTTLLA